MRWIVPVRFDPENPCVFDCVNSIREHHPDDPVLVIDSDSPDRSYMDKVDAPVIDLHNQHYAHGAFKWAYRNLPDEFFALIFDSLMIKSNLAFLEDRPVTATRHFRQPPNSWGTDDHGYPLKTWAEDQMGWPMPDEFVGIQGPMMFASRSVLDELDREGFWNIKIQSRFQHEGLERLTGILLARLGYDMTNSLQGEQGGLFDHYDTTHVEKLNFARD